ncbi:MAG: ribosome recycling factor [Armatimonadetes bacterium]|nr:ribosome recycling factor [Armatimonadota bacterium]
MIDDLLKDAKHKMSQALQATQRDFNTIRTGRANPLMLERIMVDYYGVETPINQIASISVPDPRQLLIQPYDKSIVQAVEKAIQKSDLGINPTSDANGIRLKVPEMTEDRRKDMVKQVNARAEDGCVAVRNVRRHLIDHLKKAQKNKEMSEDELKRHEHDVQKMTDEFVTQIHELQKKKDEELMEV